MNKKIKGICNILKQNKILGNKILGNKILGNKIVMTNYIKY
jgi:hypothetical protein